MDMVSARWSKKLFWHWSPNLNMTGTGWNEGLIVYVLAASSPNNDKLQLKLNKGIYIVNTTDGNSKMIVY
jgi:hypothetical protein